jgi:transcriptional regulator GlxA family with amidase domain
MTPAEFVERARVDAARVLLESSNDPLKTVAHRCGFGSPAHMRAAFRRHLNVSALDYRQHFGAYRDAASDQRLRSPATAGATGRAGAAVANTL